MLIDLEAELKLLRPSALKLWQDEIDGLTVEVEGNTTRRVRASLLFPLTGRTEFIRITDEEGSEVGTIRSLDILDPASRTALEHELSRVYFIPQVTRIEKIKEEFGTWQWDVETNSGSRKFEVADRRDVRFLDSHHVVIRDVDGNRYEIPNLHNLDDNSLHMIETEL